MKKMIIMLVISGILAILTIGSGFSAQAEELSTEEKRDSLLQRGVPTLYLNSLDEDAIDEVYEKFIDGSMTCETTTSFLTEGSGSCDEGIMPYGTISSSDMWFNLTRIAEYSLRRLQYMVVYVDFSWNIEPKYQKADAIAVNWDPNVLTYKSGSFNGYYEMDYNDRYTFGRHELESPQALTQGGLGYEVEFVKRSGHFYDPSYLYGESIFTLLPARPIYTGQDYNAVVNAQYRHNWHLFYPSIGFSTSGPTVGFGFTNMTDSTTASFNLSYALTD